MSTIFFTGFPGFLGSELLPRVLARAEGDRALCLIQPKFADLGLKWYAVPLLAEMALVIGGVIYPCAPFNGFYMETEIGARNFADTERYDMLPRIGRLFGLDTGSDRTLWRDRALVELNRAVLHSYDAAGVTIGDHHTLGAQFEAFCRAEEQAGRGTFGVYLGRPA